MTTPHRALPGLGLSAAAGLGALFALAPWPALAACAVSVVVVLAWATPLAALGLLLVLAPLRALVETELGWPLPLDVGQVALGLFLAVWALHWAGHPHRTLRTLWTPLAWPLLLFLAAGLASGLGALAFGAWAREWLKWAQMLALALALQPWLGQQRWRWILGALAAAASANALVGIYQFFGGSGALHLLVNERYFRAFGTFGQPNPFGAMMGLTLPVTAAATLGLLWRVGQRWRATQRVDATALLSAAALGAAAVLCATGVLLSWSRGAWLATVAAACVCVLAWPRQVHHSVLLLLLGGLLMAGAWRADALPDAVTTRLGSITTELFAVRDVRGVEITPANYAVVERLAHWQAALRMAQQRPWTGVGLGNYEAAYDDVRLLNWDEALGHAHNTYLNTLAEAGLAGLVAYAVLWLWLGALTWRARQHPDAVARAVAVGLLGTWTYLAVHSLTDNLLVNNLFLHVGALLGVLGALHRQSRVVALQEAL